MADNPYIRTYAKDVAALSGKTPAAPSPVATFSADAKRQSVLDRLRSRAAQASPQGEGDAELLPHSMPLPVPKAEPIGSPLPPPPTPVPSSAAMPPQRPVVPPTPPVQAPSVWQPEVTVPQPPPPPAPPEFVPPTPRIAPVSLDTVSPIHTYTSDFSDRIDRKGASAFSVLAAQSDQGALAPAAKAPRTGRAGTFMVIGATVLVLVGAAIAVAAFGYVRSHQSVAIAPSVPSLIFADDRQAVSGEGADLMRALANSADTPLPEGQVRVLYLTAASTTANNQIVNEPLPGGQLIGALQLPAPDILLRNIGNDSTVGVVHAGSETRVFFIMSVLSYERVFAGLLNWEGSMGDQLALLYPSYPTPAAPAPTVATTTRIVNGKRVVATTTAATAPVAVAPPHFVDEVASNHDVRALKDDQGRTILLYGFRDKNTLIIARDEAAFAELVNRLSATKQQ